MHLYMSGIPDNDVFQIIENQICTHRLFSMHEDYASAVFRWLETIKAGVRTVDDLLAARPALLTRLKAWDERAKRLLSQQKCDDQWMPYAEALRIAGAARAPYYPRHIMLDSGAFTAWTKKRRVSLGHLCRLYADFLHSADGLFDEIWLVNLDDIPGEQGREATPDEKARSIEASDRNLDVLRAEFGDRVLPVFHQGEGKERFLDILDQAEGYVCLSPQNGLPERRRAGWVRVAIHAIYQMDYIVRTHGLATTGNEMIREARLHSGDSAAWKQHGGKFGIVDLVTSELVRAENVSLNGSSVEWEEREIVHSQRPIYAAFHIARDRNDFDRRASKEIIDNARHFTNLPPDEQSWVRERVE